MKQGIYEQLICITLGPRSWIAEEARKLLSTYLAAVTRRELKIVRGTDGRQDGCIRADSNCLIGVM
ncbi:hypothetical protein [Paenibacillus xylanexedens]|uniref:hypothetical protein n=1 Tax=Paenibacillus xylanexedens TaxID=528191 RepID=UPI0011A621A9|nr:hypothetical protein [Paenibacillus xylanexedens]